MKLRTCEYNENVFGIRVAHIDFYLEKDGYVACPFTKGEVNFSDQLVNEIEKVFALTAERDAAQAKLNHESYLSDKRAEERNKAESENARLRVELESNLSMKQDALDSYAQLVDVIAQVLGMDASIPSQSFDEAILGAIIKGKEAMTELDALKAENAKLREAYKWIDVLDRLPDNSNMVCVIVSSGNSYTYGTGFYDDNHWYVCAEIEGEKIYVGSVTDWFELPHHKK